VCVCTTQTNYSNKVPGGLDQAALAFSSANGFHTLPWSDFQSNISWVEIASAIGSLPPIVLRMLDFDGGLFAQEIERMRVYNDNGEFAYYDMPPDTSCEYSLPFYQCTWQNYFQAMFIAHVEFGLPKVLGVDIEEDVDPRVVQSWSTSNATGRFNSMKYQARAEGAQCAACGWSRIAHPAKFNSKAYPMNKSCAHSQSCAPFPCRACRWRSRRTML
jgi:hypothetical protein